MKKKKLYIHPGCSTCKKALKFTDTEKVTCEILDIRENVPTKSELKKALAYYGDIKKLFNTSGQSYRSQNIKEKLSRIIEAEAIELLSSDGMLVKRPFLVIDDACLVGFKETEWRENL